MESSTDEDNLAWRLELNWFATPDTLLYSSITQGAKAGNTPVNAANISTQNAPVGQEKLLAYEAGVKATLLEQRGDSRPAADRATTGSYPPRPGQMVERCEFAGELHGWRAESLQYSSLHFQLQQHRRRLDLSEAFFQAVDSGDES